MNVVFVHLGVSPAKHLWANLRYFDREFPEIKKYVVLSEEIHLKKLNRINVEVVMVQESALDTEAIRKLEHDDAFRSGFWKYSLQRIYALKYFQNEISNENMIHFESDILVFPSFPWEKFENQSNLIWPRFNRLSDAAAVFYSPSEEAITKLIAKLEKAINYDPKLTDMTALSIIRSEQDLGYRELPTLFEGKEQTGADYFDGIFDAAAIGMWLTGRDPRNHLGWIKRFLLLPEADMQAGLYRYKLKNGQLTMISRDGVERKVHNLHLHSKRLGLFGKRWRTFLWCYVLTSRRNLVSSWFSPKAFLSLFHDYFSRNPASISSVVKLAFRFKDRNAG